MREENGWGSIVYVFVENVCVQMKGESMECIVGGGGRVGKDSVVWVREKRESRVVCVCSEKGRRSGECVL